jgi:DNA-binding IclR family transcriptional regulator
MTKKKKAGKREYQVPNLRRGIRIMETLSHHPNGLKMSELAKILDLPNNSVFRITRTLMDMGYLQRDTESRRVSLTRKLLGVAYAAVSEHSLVEEALEEMRLLRDKTGETVIIAILADTESIVLEQVVGLHPFKFFVEPGSHIPLHTSAHGKAILAFLPDDEREELIDRIKLNRFNARTITSKKILREELEHVRQHRYAIDKGEQIQGVHCVAAPILDQKRYPIAAITVTGPENRVAETSFPEIGQMVIECTEKVSSHYDFDRS